MSKIKLYISTAETCSTVFHLSLQWTNLISEIYLVLWLLIINSDYWWFVDISSFHQYCTNAIVWSFTTLHNSTIALFIEATIIFPLKRTKVICSISKGYSSNIFLEEFCPQATMLKKRKHKMKRCNTEPQVQTLSIQ